MEGARHHRNHWPSVMGRLVFLGSRELSRTALDALSPELNRLERVAMLEYFMMPIPLDLKRKFYEASFAEQVEIRGKVIDKLKQFFQD